MEWWTKVRLEVLRGRRVNERVLRDEGIHWESVKERILEHPELLAIGLKEPRPKRRSRLP